jgi:hypothetical protein
MTDKPDSKKPVTLADYIPPEPDPAPASRRAPSQRDRERLDALDLSVRDDAENSKARPKRKPKKKPSFWTMVFWIVMIIVIANIVD